MCVLIVVDLQRFILLDVIVKHQALSGAGGQTGLRESRAHVQASHYVARTTNAECSQPTLASCLQLPYKLEVKPRGSSELYRLVIAVRSSPAYPESSRSTSILGVLETSFRNCRVPPYIKIIILYRGTHVLEPSRQVDHSCHWTCQESGGNEAWHFYGVTRPP